MKRQLCSYDMLAVPDPCYLLRDDVGGIYFCSVRCFAIWAVQRATMPKLAEAQRSGVFYLTTPGGEEHRMIGLVEVARWVTTVALR